MDRPLHSRDRIRTPMTQPIIQVKRMASAHGLPLPAYATAGASAFDVPAAVQVPLEIPAGKWALIPTGLQLAIPAGYELQLRPRSGLALKHGITLPNSPATIDEDYRGELGVIVHNTGEKPFVVERGARICQAVLAPVMRGVWQEVAELPETARGGGGFGSTGEGAAPATAPAAIEAAPDSPPPPPPQTPQEAFDSWFMHRYPRPGMIDSERPTEVAMAAWLAGALWLSRQPIQPPPPGQRFVSPCPPPNPREAEELVTLMEECAEMAIELGEVQQRAAKVMRFGVHEVQPGQPWSNRDRLSFEVGDLLEVVALMKRDGLLDADLVAEGRAHKRQQLARFLQVVPPAPPPPAESTGTGMCTECRNERPGAILSLGTGRLVCGDCRADQA